MKVTDRPPSALMSTALYKTDVPICPFYCENDNAYRPIRGWGLYIRLALVTTWWICGKWMSWSMWQLTSMATRANGRCPQLKTDLFITETTVPMVSMKGNVVSVKPNLLKSQDTAYWDEHPLVPSRHWWLDQSFIYPLCHGTWLHVNDDEPTGRHTVKRAQELLTLSAVVEAGDQPRPCTMTMFQVDVPSQVSVPLSFMYSR